MTRASKLCSLLLVNFVCVCVRIQFLLNMLENRKVLAEFELACVLLNCI